MKRERLLMDDNLNTSDAKLLQSMEVKDQERSSLRDAKPKESYN
jgi:hypothetical protein